VLLLAARLAGISERRWVWLGIVASVEEALAVPTDVLIDYTAHDVVKDHILTALDKGVRVIVGTSGLTAGDYAELVNHPYAFL